MAAAPGLCGGALLLLGRLGKVGTLQGRHWAPLCNFWLGLCPNGISVLGAGVGRTGQSPVPMVVLLWVFQAALPRSACTGISSTLPPCPSSPRGWGDVPGPFVDTTKNGFCTLHASPAFLHNVLYLLSSVAAWQTDKILTAF